MQNIYYILKDWIPSIMAGVLVLGFFLFLVAGNFKTKPISELESEE